MASTYNLKAVHRDGNAELQIGLRDNPFTISRTENGIKLTDSKSGNSLTLENVYTKDEVEALIEQKINERLRSI